MIHEQKQWQSFPVTSSATNWLWGQEVN